MISMQIPLQLRCRDRAEDAGEFRLVIIFNFLIPVFDIAAILICTAEVMHRCVRIYEVCGQRFNSLLISLCKPVMPVDQVEAVRRDLRISLYQKQTGELIHFSPHQFHICYFSKLC